MILSRYARLGSSSRVRFFQYIPWFAHEGIACDVMPFFQDVHLKDRYEHGRYRFLWLVQNYYRRMRAMARRGEYDLVWVEKEALPWIPVWMERRLLRGVPYAVDLDDAVFHLYDRHSCACVRAVFGRRIDAVMAGSRVVTAGNEYLAARAREAGAKHVAVVPSVVDLERYSAEPARTPGDSPLRIGWIGSPSTQRYLEGLKSTLSRLARTCNIVCRVIGASGIDLPGVPTERIPWHEETEVEALRQCDIGVMPLEDAAWERGKCGYKLIQYMASGLPVVASPVGCNTTIVRDGENGFLARSAEQWEHVLTVLLHDAGLRRRMGAAGRRCVREYYCLQQQAPRLIGLLRAAAREDTDGR